MKVSKHFDLEELTHSNTGESLGIKNHPNFQEQKNLTLLAQEYLDPIREFLKRPLRLTCAFRNEEVNRLVGGVSNSIHLQGKAADMIILKKDYKKVMLWLRDKFPMGIKAITYTGRNFIHINIESSGTKEFFNCPGKGKYPPYKFGK